MKKLKYILALVLLLLLKNVNAQPTVKLFGTELSIIVIFPLAVIIISILLFLGLFIKDQIEDRKRKKEEEKKVKIELKKEKIEEIKEDHEKIKPKKDFLKKLDDFELKLLKLNPDAALEDFASILKDYLAYTYNIDVELTYDELKSVAKREDELEMLENLNLFKYSGKEYTKDDIKFLLNKLRVILKEKDKEEQIKEQQKLKYRLVKQLKDLKNLELFKVKKTIKLTLPTEEKSIEEEKPEERVVLVKWILYKIKTKYYRLRYLEDRKKIIDLIEKGKGLLKIDPIAAKKVYSLALLKYYKLPVEEETKLVDLIASFYKEIELYTGKRNVTRAARKLINLKQREKEASELGVQHIERLLNDIRREEFLLKYNLGYIFKDLRIYEDKFLQTLANYVLHKEKKLSFVRDEEEKLLTDLKSALENISNKRRFNLAYTKAEFHNLVENVKKAVLNIKEAEKGDFKFTKEEDIAAINALTSFFHYITSKEAEIISSINIFEKKLAQKEREEFNKISLEFNKDIQQFSDFIEFLKDYLLHCEKEDYQIIQEEDIIFHNRLNEFSNAVAEKEKLGIKYFIDFERSFVNEVKFYFENLNKMKEKVRIEVLEKLPDYIERNYSKIKLKQLELSLLKQIKHEKEELKFKLVKHPKTIAYTEGIFKKIKTYLDREEKISGFLKEEERYFLYKIKELNKVIRGKEHNIIEALKDFAHREKPTKELFNDIEDYIMLKEKQALGTLKEDEIKLVQNLKSFFAHLKTKKSLAVKEIPKIKAAKYKPELIKKKKNIFYEFSYLVKKDEEKFVDSLKRFVSRQEKRIRTLHKIEKEFLYDLKLFLKFIEFMGIGLVEDEKKLVNLIKEALAKKQLQPSQYPLQILTGEEREAMKSAVEGHVTYQPIELEIKKKALHIKKLEEEELKMMDKVKDLERKYTDLVKQQYVEAEHLKPKEEQFTFPKVRHTKEYYKLIEQEKQLKEKLHKLESLFN